MRRLADHYARFRQGYPDDRLLVVFDIDGTILDLRYMVRYVLLDYDRAHGSDLFHGLSVEDIDVHENRAEEFLEGRALAAETREHVLAWYLERRWQPDSVLAAHRPYRGVLEVIRWFQLQPATFVGLNTGRPEQLRDETLRSLNALGREYRVEFRADLLAMNESGEEGGVIESKVAGLRTFADAGFRTFAVVDNEPAVITALAEADESWEILFLQAQTFSESRRVPTPRTVRGRSYDLTALVTEEDLPHHVQLVWHGVNDEANLRQFLGSQVHWAECDVRRDPLGRLVLRHDSFERTPWSSTEKGLELGDLLAQLLARRPIVVIEVFDPASGAFADAGFQLPAARTTPTCGSTPGSRRWVKTGSAGSWRRTPTPSCSARSTSSHRWCSPPPSGPGTPSSC
jgi:beta-phosphoglucomutase-like phosphatase (HAD superfamily)